MKKMNLIVILMLTFINIIIASCGNNSAQATGTNNYRYEYILGHYCITNDVSIWCKE